MAAPVSIAIDTFDTQKVQKEILLKAIRENFDLDPDGIIRMLGLRRPIFFQTATYGHFGRNELDLPWEKLDKANQLKEYVKRTLK